MNNDVDFQINIGGNAIVSLTNIANQFEEVRGEAKKTESLISRISERLILVNQSFELAGNVSSVFQSLAGAGLEFEKQQTNLLTLLNGNAEAAERLSESITRYGSATPYDRTSLLGLVSNDVVWVGCRLCFSKVEEHRRYSLGRQREDEIVGIGIFASHCIRKIDGTGSDADD